MNKILLCLILACFAAVGCSEDSSAENWKYSSAPSSVSMPKEITAAENTAAEGNIEWENELRLFVNETLLPVKWEENEAAAALSAFVRKGPLTIHMERYGGFTWAYTKLGRIEGVSDEEFEHILSDDRITATLSFAGE